MVREIQPKWLETLERGTFELPSYALNCWKNIAPFLANGNEEEEITNIKLDG